MKHPFLFCAALALTLFSQELAFAQAPAARSILGTITSFDKDAQTLQVKPENGTPVAVKLSNSAVVQRIAPGQTDLKNASTITPAEVSVGDRVLVTLASNGTDALRLVVMSAGDIAKRDDAERQDWNRRGISGIVSTKNGGQILLKTRTPRGDIQQTIAVNEKTKFRRYAPDSVRFGDAKPSTFDEVAVGDQIRARGNKSPDNLRVDAEEVVFGTFVTKAGSVVSVDTATKDITVKELGSGKQFVVKVTADSSIKQMPSAPADGRGAPPAGGNVAQIVESLPAAKIDDVKTGASIVVSGTKGSDADKVTAILIVANADLLIRMASTPTGRGGTLVFGSADGGGLNVLGLQ